MPKKVTASAETGVKTPLEEDIAKLPKRKTAPETSANKLLESINKLVIDIIDKDMINIVVTQSLPKVQEKIIEIYGELPNITRVVLPSLEVKNIPGTTHEQFETVLAIANQNIPVYLEGPAGSGKNIICKQVADALGLDFYFTNAVTQEYKLTGFIDAHGVYQETQFYKAFKNGGLFFLDEIDASIPEVLIILNAAIANRYFDFPIGKVEAHPNFRVIAAGNTIGTGADSNYTGRFCLDRASLDRFAMIHIDYSPKIEYALCDNNKELINFIHEFRAATKRAGIECICSYRSVERISSLEKILPLQDVMNMSLLKGLEVDDIKVLSKEMKKMETNKYFCEGILGKKAANPVTGLSDDDLKDIPF